MRLIPITGTACDDHTLLRAAGIRISSWRALATSAEAIESARRRTSTISTDTTRIFRKPSRV